MRLPDPRALRRRTSRAPARLRPTTRQAEGHLRLAYRPAIDGLRAIAVVSVMLFHFDTGLDGGFLGVDVFFVLSGFLIVRLLTAEQSRYGSIDVWGFYKRRIRRLLPALLVMLLVVMAWGTLAAPEGIRRKLGGDEIAPEAAVIVNADGFLDVLHPLRLDLLDQSPCPDGLHEDALVLVKVRFGHARLPGFRSGVAEPG